MEAHFPSNMHLEAANGFPEVCPIVKTVVAIRIPAEPAEKL
jgi:hypothetical protein